MTGQIREEWEKFIATHPQMKYDAMLNLAILALNEALPTEALTDEMLAMVNIIEIGDIGVSFVSDGKRVTMCDTAFSNAFKLEDTDTGLVIYLDESLDTREDYLKAFRICERMPNLVLIDHYDYTQNDHAYNESVRAGYGLGNVSCIIKNLDIYQR